jgi:tetratricopeptide (TPR) repeat protein
LALTPALSRASHQAASVPSLLAQAQKALEARDLEQAKSYLHQALRADPKSAEAHLMLGAAEFQGGETDRAIESYRRGLELRPASFSGHYNLALAYLRKRDRAGGLRELRRAVALDARHADAVYNLGLVLLDSGQPEEALQRLHQARELGSNRPDVAFSLVRAELTVGQPDRARDEAAQAARTFGADPDWRAGVGRLFLEQGQPRDAVPHLQEALRLRPDWDEARRQLAAADLQAEQPAAVLDLIPNPTAAEDHFLRASADYLLRRLEEAKRESSRALELEPHQPRYLLLGARLRQRAGQHAAALELLREASLLAPRWAEPHYSAGVSYYFERRYAEARRSLDRALELDPRSARSLFLYAATLVNEGQNRQGEGYLRRAIALEPSSARFEYHLGALLVRDLNRITRCLITNSASSSNERVTRRPPRRSLKKRSNMSPISRRHITSWLAFTRGWGKRKSRRAPWPRSTRSRNRRSTKSGNFWKRRIRNLSFRRMDEALWRRCPHHKQAVPLRPAANCRGGPRRPAVGTLRYRLLSQVGG